SYVSTARIFSLSPLQDQECAGALMWVCVTFAYLIPAVVITMQILSPGGAQREAQDVLRISSTRTEWLRSGGRLKHGRRPHPYYCYQAAARTRTRSSGRNPLRSGRLLGPHQARSEFADRDCNLRRLLCRCSRPTS